MSESNNNVKVIFFPVFVPVFIPVPMETSSNSPSGEKHAYVQTPPKQHQQDGQLHVDQVRLSPPSSLVESCSFELTTMARSSKLCFGQYFERKMAVDEEHCFVEGLVEALNSSSLGLRCNDHLVRGGSIHPCISPSSSSSRSHFFKKGFKGSLQLLSLQASSSSGSSSSSSCPSPSSSSSVPRSSMLLLQYLYLLNPWLNCWQLNNDTTTTTSTTTFVPLPPPMPTPPTTTSSMSCCSFSVLGNVCCFDHCCICDCGLVSFYKSFIPFYFNLARNGIEIENRFFLCIRFYFLQFLLRFLFLH